MYVCYTSSILFYDMWFYLIISIADNPCPHLGQIVTIMLNENEEKVLQKDNTYINMIVETHFQMNYSTGEWKRVKKYRKIEGT